ncbi:hypothetical protein BGZ50_004123 [Haplosporangium sp. Z 11]|nr:hypothetical protein BGZ50_004123 [Haplosporangium sp. Z 11]
MSSTRNSRTTNNNGSVAVSPTSPSSTQKPINRSYSNIQSKVGSFRDTPLTRTATVNTTTIATPGTNGLTTSKRPTVVTTTSRPARAASTSRVSIKAAGLPSSTTSVINSSPTSVPSTPLSFSHSRRSSTSSTMASPPMSPTSLTRRSSKYDHIKAKVGSMDNINYKGHAVNKDDDGDVQSPTNGRSRSPSAMSSASSTTSHSTSTSRSTFKIPKSKKFDYSKVQSKVGSLEFIHHTPQGGNLRVFSEKLTFREQAQSKIAKEINIVQFYQTSDNSFDMSGQEEQGAGDQVSDQNQDQDESIVYGSETSADGHFEPPKNILSVLEELVESVEDIGLDEQHELQRQQANDAQETHPMSAAAL